MKKFLSFACLTMVTVASPALSQGEDPATSVRDFRPEAHFEEIPATDASVLQCYVFKTTPGVGYQVEVSNDLIHWTTNDEVYGLGHEYVVTMRETAAAPPPEPGAPPSTPPSAPTKCASIRMQPASGTAGGIVVAWRSLDNGGPVMVKIAGTMDPGWPSVPLYASGFGDYEFFVWHPNQSIDPPAVNPLLGPEDTSMLAALEEYLPAMNTEIATSVARSRNAPPPPPTDPDSKKFWRIKVDAGIDTDTDGTPDWSEFEMAANNTGGMVAGVTGDAFNADTNNDGIPDGLQIDSDGDGTSDAKDPAVSDNTASFPIGPVPRYALFPITGRATGSFLADPMQISDKGTVLYDNATWTGGAWTELTPPSGALGYGARAINDHDVILGFGNYQIPYPDGNSPGTAGIEIFCAWNTPQAAPAIFSTGTGAAALYAVPHAQLASGGISGKSLLSSEGRFAAFTHGWKDDENLHLESLRPSFWTISTGALPPAESSRDPRIFWNQGSLEWGSGYPLDQDGKEDYTLTWSGVVKNPGLLPPLPFAPTNVVPQPGGSVIAMSDIPTQGTMVYKNGAWNTSPTYAAAIDMAADGTAIGRKSDANKAPILLNGKWKSISEYAPGVPDSWNDITVRLIDTTPGGWILAQRGVYPLIGVSDPEYSVLLPIRVDGVDPALSAPPLTPPVDPPEYLNGGVDHTSMTALGGTGKVPEIWIMAPNGGASNSVRFQSPLNATSKLTLVSDADVAFTPDKLDKNDMIVQVKGENADSADFAAKLKLGGTLDSLSVPVKIKAMKKRTVKVAVHKVFGIDGSGNQTLPSNFPAMNDLENYLNEIYGRQTNTFFQCIPYEEKGPAGTGIDFDFANSKSDNWISYNTNDPEVQALIVNPKSVGPSATANIDIWVFGGGVRIADSLQSYYGYQIGSVFEGKILIDGDLLGDQSPPDKRAKMLLNTFAHEIGHVMVGRGHANKGDCRSGLYWKSAKSSNDPNALLWDYADSRNNTRLMCADVPLNINNPTTQLIKNEWDLIEAWLKKEEDQGRL